MLAYHFCRSWFSNTLSFRYILFFLNFFVFALWVKNIFNTIKFYTISFLCKQNFFIDEKRTQWMLGTKLKVFHKSISFFMKFPWNCISWNALKEKFHRVCFPLENIFFNEVSESFLAHCYNWVVKCFMWSIKLLIVNFF